AAMLNFFRRGGRSQGSDSKYFSSTSRGERPARASVKPPCEVKELATSLSSSKPEDIKEAVKKVIAAMTVGKDMSSLVPSVVKCMHAGELCARVKKLVYLYLINYAKSNPDMTLMAVNSFVKALADEDPYVRKTAAMCVAKLYDIDPTITRDQGFLEVLVDLTSDPVPIVVANAVAALMEVQETTTRVIFDINTETLTRLLAALKDCSEWGQVVILDALSTYVPANAREAETVIERISPWLAHQNPAVVLNSVKAIVLMMDSLESKDTISALCAKLAAPLVTLAQSTHPEIQYVALRNISLVVQRYPGILSSKVRVFFCKYNEPIYVKMEKLEVLVRLANASNVESVLMELREYAQEVDVEYVRRAVRTIGRLAIKLDKAAPNCIRLLLQLIKDKTPGGGGDSEAAAAAAGGGSGTDQNYLVQEAVIVIKDIFRRYPGHYEGVIGTLCEHLGSLDEPEAKAAFVWIIGEYADRIDGAADLLEDFLDSFLEEPAQVQLALLTAVVKCYLKDPEGSDGIVQSVLQMATEESDNPDLRDRGYIYWRLLAADPDAARAVVLAEKPVVTDDTNAVPESMLTDMLAQIATLSSVYHKLPEAFVRRVRRPGEFASPAPATPSSPAVSAPVLGASNGITFRAAVVRSAGGQPELHVAITNEHASGTPFTAAAVRANRNPFGLAPTSAVATFSPAVAAGATGVAIVPLSVDGSKADASKPLGALQVAVREESTRVSATGTVAMSYAALIGAAGPLERQSYLSAFRAAADSEQGQTLRAPGLGDREAVKARLAAAGVAFVAQRAADGKVMCYYSASGASPAGEGLGATVVLVEVTHKDGVDAARICARSSAGQELAKAAAAGVASILE
ncbi:BETAC-AD, partial [Symbiodinium sp. KB8]